MEVIAVDKRNIFLLQDFINHIGEAAKTFRYFDKRDISIISRHLATLLLVQDAKPVAYGHLEKEGANVWLGICVLPSYHGRGYGNIMMEELIKKGKELEIKEISLTVDKINESAIRLYTKFGFKIVKEMESYYKYGLLLN